MKNKWTLLAFLCATFAIYTIDRALLGPLAIPIQNDTGITDVQFGILNGGIFWTFAFIVPFAGYAGDRLNRAKLIGFASIAWSVMVMLSGFATGFWSLLLLVSFAVTAPQTLYAPSAFALLAARHKETRTVAFSCHQAAYYAGWFLSGAAVAVILWLFGSWRAAYFVMGAVGCLLGVAFLLSSRSGESSGSVAQAVENVNKPGVMEVVKAFFCCPSAVIAALGHVAFTAVAFGYSAWGPKFVALKFNISAGAAGTGVMFWHFAASFVAVLLAGMATDRFVRKMPRFRLALQSVSLLASAPMLIMFGYSPSLWMVWTVAALFGVTKGAFEANSVNSIYDVMPANCRSSAIGFLNVLTGVLGSLAPISLGWLSQHQGIAGLEKGFAAMGLVMVFFCGLMCVSLFHTFYKDRITE